jgi:predicted TIM-barrel fold metal-dependent hydrolase
MIVDVHTQVFPPDVVAQRDQFIDRDEAFRAVYEDERVPIATARDLIAALDDAGIDRAVVCGFSWSDAGLCRTHSDYLLQEAASSEGRLIAFCTVHPAADGGRKEMERLAARGARGLGELRPDLQGYSLVDSEEADLLAWAAAAYDLTLMFHATAPDAAGRSFLQQFVRFAGDFPGVNVIAAYLGGALPFYALMPEVGHALETAYVDTAGAARLYRQDAVLRVTELVGVQRVLFGSGFPSAAPKDELSAVRAAGLDGKALGLVFGGNATTLMRLGT